MILHFMQERGPVERTARVVPADRGQPIRDSGGVYLPASLR